MQPLQFQPILKRIRWGGRRLGELLAKPLGEHDDYAESWELADHGDDQSRVVHGEFRDWPLKRLIAEKGTEVFGTKGDSIQQFPLLIKYLDANDSLSVQVHPDDELARQFDPTENGKTEAWVIIDAQPGAVLYAGLKVGIDRDALERAIAEGTVADCLHKLPVSAGDCIFIPAGTVHAIGAGIVLAEVQQSSDITFRLYDWDRLGTDGNPRELHIEQSLQCIDFDRGPVDPVSPVPIEETPFEQLAACAYFDIQRATIDRPLALPQHDSFTIVMTLAGQGRLSTSQTSYELAPGQTILVPADCEAVTITPTSDTLTSELTFLKVNA